MVAGYQINEKVSTQLCRGGRMQFGRQSYIFYSTQDTDQDENQ